MRTLRPRRARRTLAAVGLLNGCLGIAAAVPAEAQIVHDGSLGMSGPVSPVGNQLTISADRGKVEKSNLFHSFAKFNVTSDQTASFTVPSGVGRIIARATDGTRSTIDGKVTADTRGVDFIFANSSGIQVGPNAKFDFGGIVCLTTADEIGLQDGAVFSSLPNAVTDAVLTTAAPSAFGFLGPAAPAPIEINKVGAKDRRLHDTPEQSPTAYSFIGGDIAVRGALTVVEGQQSEDVKRPARADFISVHSAGQVVFDPADESSVPQGLESFAELGDVTFADGARIEVGSVDETAPQAGRILIRAGKLELNESNIRVRSNNAEGLGVDIEARGSLTTVGESSIRTSTVGPANGGPIRITAGSIELRGGHIRSDTEKGNGRGGDVLVTAGSVRLTPNGLVPAEILSYSFSGDEDSGRGGDVRVTSATPIVMDEAASQKSRIFTHATSSGAAGDVFVDAPAAESLDAAAVFSARFGDGPAGVVRLNGAAQTLPASVISFDGTAGAPAGPIPRDANDDGTPGGTFTVDGEDGVQVASNLFFSFDQLSLNRQETLTFNVSPAAGVRNIVTRVTGGQASVIDGRVVSPRSATLFVLNPAGVMLGPASSLDLGGSVVFTSASAVRFASGGVFGVGSTFAGAPDAAEPAGLEFGATPGPLTLRGIPLTSSAPDKFRTSLAVDANRVFTLAGGDVTLDSRTVMATGDLGRAGNEGAGRVNIVSVGSAGTVTFDAASSTAALEVNAPQLGTLRMTDKANVLADGVEFRPGESQGGRGRVDVRVGSMAMTGGSLIQSTASAGLDSAPGFGIDIRATGDVLIEESLVTTLTAGASDGGPLSVAADNLTIVGNGGNAPVQFELFGQGLLSDVQDTDVDATGRGGDVFVNVNNLTLRSAGKIEAKTNSVGAGGNITVSAEHVLLDNEASTDFTVIGAQSSAPISGIGGNVTLGPDGRMLTLELRNGAAILANTLSKSNGGSISIWAKESVTIDGTTQPMQSDGTPRLTSIDATARPFKLEAEVPAGLTEHGDAGSIDLRTGLLAMRGFSEITTGTQTSGDGGNIKVVADTLEMSGVRVAPDPTSENRPTAYNPSIFAGTGRNTLNPEQAEPLTGNPLGKGGSIEVEAGNATMRDGATIATSTANKGQAGFVLVRVEDTLLIEGTVNGDPSAIESRTSFSRDGTIAEGGAGNIEVHADTFILRDGGRLRSDSQSFGNSGNIWVEVGRSLEIGDGSEITTSVVPLQRVVEDVAAGLHPPPVAGGVTVESGGTIVLRDGGTNSLPLRARIAALNTIGNAGSISVKAPRGNISLTNAAVTTEAAVTTNAAVTGGAVVVEGGGALTLDRARVNASAGSGVGGDVQIDVAGRISLSDSQVTTDAAGGGGKIVVRGGSALTLDRSGINATARAGDGGDVDISTPGRISLTDSQVTTDAGGAGGDIRMRTFVLALDHSAITANAVALNAGNIDIEAIVVGLETSVIEATSERGLSDPDFFSPPETDLAGLLVVLTNATPETPVALEPTCHERAGTASSFLAIGRGGGPSLPGGWEPYLPLAWEPSAGGDEGK